MVRNTALTTTNTTSTDDGRVFDRRWMEGPACLAEIIRIETKRVVVCVCEFE